MWAALTAERLYRRRTQTGFVNGLKSFRICRVRANVPFLLQVVNGALANATTLAKKILFLRSRSKKLPLVILFFGVLLYFITKRTKLVSTYLH